MPNPVKQARLLVTIKTAFRMQAFLAQQQIVCLALTKLTINYEYYNNYYYYEDMSTPSRQSYVLNLNISECLVNVYWNSIKQREVNLFKNV